MAGISFRDRKLNIHVPYVPPEKRTPSSITRKAGEELTDTKVLVNNVTVRPIHRGSVDINKWRKAIQSAEGYYQNRKDLFELYEDIILDGYLQSVMEKRTEQVTNRKLVFTDANGERNEELTKLAQTSYFEDLLREIIAAKFWGHSLLELYWPGPGDDFEGETLLVPRKHVKPRFGIVVKEAHDHEGTDYRASNFNKRTIEVGAVEDLGLLKSVSQYVIYKRANFGDWAEYAEIFGIPFRWATYNNEQSREVLEAAMETAGSAGYVVAPADAELQFLNANNTGQGQEVFRTLRMACNEEIGLAFLGNTMTTIESKAGGYAQSKTQAAGENERAASDRRFCLREINEQLLRVLENLGWDVDGGAYEWEQEDAMTLHQRIDVDLKLSSVIDMPKSYFYDKYGIPMPDGNEDSTTPQREDTRPENQPNGPDPDAKEDDEKPGKPGKLNARTLTVGGRAEAIADFYADHETECPRCVNLVYDLPDVTFDPIPMKLQDQFSRAVRLGRIGVDDISEELHAAYFERMERVVRAGFTRNLDVAQDFEDFELTQGIKRNLSAFAAAKHQALTEQLISLRGLSRKEYDRQAAAILRTFNDGYLRTELLTLEFMANSAGQWRDFEERADIFPNLTYSTADDDRVRDSHRQLDGATYPVGHPFWDTHTPPIDWRCRCTLTQTDRPQKGAEGLPPRVGFGNPGKTRRLVQQDHPYFALPTERLARLLEVSETLRAALELERVTERARAQVQKELLVPGVGRLNMLPDEIEELFSTDSASLATRNALLAELELTLSGMERSDYDGRYIFDFTVNAETFRIWVGRDDNLPGWQITQIEKHAQ